MNDGLSVFDALARIHYDGVIEHQGHHVTLTQQPAGDFEMNIDGFEYKSGFGQHGIWRAFAYYGIPIYRGWSVKEA